MSKITSAWWVVEAHDGEVLSFEDNRESADAFNMPESPTTSTPVYLVRMDLTFDAWQELLRQRDEAVVLLREAHSQFDYIADFCDSHGDPVGYPNLGGECRSRASAIRTLLSQLEAENDEGASVSETGPYRQLDNNVYLGSKIVCVCDNAAQAMGWKDKLNTAYLAGKAAGEERVKIPILRLEALANAMESLDVSQVAARELKDVIAALSRSGGRGNG